jgi:diacylglycerol kinase family enzyme
VEIKQPKVLHSHNQHLQIRCFFAHQLILDNEKTNPFEKERLAIEDRDLKMDYSEHVGENSAFEATSLAVMRETGQRIAGQMTESMDEKTVLLVASNRPKWFKKLEIAINPTKLSFISFLKTKDIPVSGKVLLLAVGGDGILSYCVNNCIAKNQKNVTIFNVPLGTSNDFHFGSMNGKPFDLDALANAIVNEWNSVKVNVSLFFFPKSSTQRTMINVGSMGLSSQVKPVKALGRFSYRISGFFEAFKNPFFPVRIKINGQWKEYEKVSVLAICNGKCYGGRIFIGGPLANPLEQENYALVVTVVKFVSIWRLLWLFFKMFFQRDIKCTEIEYYQTREPIRIETVGKRMPVEIDGDVVEELPCIITPKYSSVNYLTLPDN